MTIPKQPEASGKKHFSTTRDFEAPCQNLLANSSGSGADLGRRQARGSKRAIFLWSGVLQLAQTL